MYFSANIHWEWPVFQRHLGHSPGCPKACDHVCALAGDPGHQEAPKLQRAAWCQALHYCPILQDSALGPHTPRWQLRGILGYQCGLQISSLARDMWKTWKDNSWLWVWVGGKGDGILHPKIQKTAVKPWAERSLGRTTALAVYKNIVKSLSVSGLSNSLPRSFWGAWEKYLSRCLRKSRSSKKAVIDSKLWPSRFPGN